ncbi:hypothetical protein HYX09_03915 [Candidatus Woesearchaeota archaeon]|nr:hypothetical protein [Candidatus Woesearchaeota archaeon]
MGKPRVIMTGEGRKFFVKDTSKDFHTQFGYIKSSDLAGKEGAKILSNTNVEFSIFPPYFIDLYQRLKRDAQIIPLKDIGAIVAETGINKKRHKGGFHRSCQEKHRAAWLEEPKDKKAGYL